MNSGFQTYDLGSDSAFRYIPRMESGDFHPLFTGQMLHPTYYNESKRSLLSMCQIELVCHQVKS